jgi:hypothetical protein
MIYRWHAGLVLTYGVWLIASPAWFYGPSWWYFSRHGLPVFPAGGFGMGVCCVGLGALQLIAIRRDMVRTVSVLLYLAGFVLWTAGLLLGAEGLLGRKGLQEVPLMCVFGVLKVVQSFKLSVDYRVQRERR